MGTEDSTMFHRSNNGESLGLLASQALAGVEIRSMALQKLSENSSKVPDAAMTTADTGTLPSETEWSAPESRLLSSPSKEAKDQILN